MSNISDIVQSAQGGAFIDNVADRFGLSREQAKSAVYALIPALSLALQKAAADPATLAPVVEKLSGESQYYAAFENPEVAHSDMAVEQGRAAVEQLFGSAATTGQVAQLAARESGIRPDIINQLLPVLVSAVLGGLFKSFKDQGLGQILGQIAGSGGLGSAIEQIGRGGGGSPPPAPQQSAPTSSPLGGLLGGLLGALLGGRAARSSTPPEPAPASQGAQGGIDAQSLDAAIERITKTFQPGAAQPSADHQMSLEDILGQLLGSGRR
jgi:hypothetical protein